MATSVGASPPSCDVTIVRLPDDTTNPNSSLELSPFDVSARGRAIPMLWYYGTTIDSAHLISSLRDTLAYYPVLCGRYDTTGSKVNLNNAGVPVEVTAAEGKVQDAMTHLLPGDSNPQPSTFTKDSYLKFQPSAVQIMDPDNVKTEAPLLAVRITQFQPGTVIFLLLQHGVCDGEAMISFMNSWSRVFRGLSMEGSFAPDHNRYFDGDVSPDVLPDVSKLKVTAKGQPLVPAFAAVMPKIMGNQVCVVPMTKEELAALKASASVGIPEGKFVSTDDVVTALVWKTMCKIRCGQLDIPVDSQEMTTCMRALNVRSRVNPPLSPTYCGNAVFPVWTELSICRLLSLSITEVALALRATVQTYSSEQINALAKWKREQQKSGGKTYIVMDKNAMSFVISSWLFPKASWEDADFQSPPLVYEHGAHVPIVCVFTSRAGGQGINIWTSGQSEAMDKFIAGMTLKD